MVDIPSHVCPVCDMNCRSLGGIDSSKSCEDHKGQVLPATGVLVEYVLCEGCGFCFAPDLYRWTLDEFAERIYNDDYQLVDPDFAVTRPTFYADQLLQWFGRQGGGATHLDYGGGQGLLSDFLRDAGWRSTSYDPYYERHASSTDLGTFDLITAFEVFEHVPDVNALVSDLAALLNKDGSVIFTTMLTDGHIRAGEPLTWWYAAPRNGHISLYSRKSLELLANKAGLNFGTNVPGLHAFWRTRPPLSVL